MSERRPPAFRLRLLTATRCRRVGGLLLVGSALLLGAAAPGVGGSVQVTDNSTDDTAPQLSGSNLAWACRPGGVTPEICFRDGVSGTTVQVTVGSSSAPVGDSLSGSNLAWAGWDGSDREIFFWDASTGVTTQVTNNSSNDRFPALSGSELAWYRDYQLFFWSASTGVTTLITATGVDANCKLAVSGSNVVWRGHDGNDYEIFFWDGSSITQITNNVGPTDLDQVVSGSNVAWKGTDGTLGDWEIFFWEESTGVTTQITSNDTTDEYPVISGSRVAWERSDGADREIFLWDGYTGVTTQITNNTVDDFGVAISGAALAWVRSDGNDYEIFLALPEPAAAFQRVLALGVIALFAQRLRVRHPRTAS